MRRDLLEHGFERVGLWSRGVDTKLFRPHDKNYLREERPILMYAGRVAVEKGLETFLSIDTPGTKYVVGDGPALTALRRRYPNVVYAGYRFGEELARHVAAADVFVFPSRTDTFGVAQLEALACGVPVAAFPVTGPKDVIGDHAIGVLDEDLRSACLNALNISREACRAFALTRSWTTSARQFIGHVDQVAMSRSRQPVGARPVAASVQG